MQDAIAKMSAKLSKEIILEKLSGVFLPDAKDNVVSAGLISSLVIKDNDVGFVIDLNNIANSNIGEELRNKCEEAVKSIPGVAKVTAVMTAEISNEEKRETGKKNPKKIEGIKHIIAVASGKGGVGKSTVAVNLAVALVKEGYVTGLVDADIYGPSVARMMNLSGEPEVKEARMIPPENYGVKTMSMGLLLAEDAAVVWRGPMISKALQQLMMGANWGNLDFLVIDLPPGTGDIHLSIAQNFDVSGVVIVSTPQEVALLDVKKAIAMFAKVHVQVLGVVENMSYFDDPDTGKRNYIFGKGSVKKMASEQNLDILAEIPLNSFIW